MEKKCRHLHRADDVLIARDSRIRVFNLFLCIRRKKKEREGEGDLTRKLKKRKKKEKKKKIEQGRGGGYESKGRRQGWQRNKNNGVSKGIKEMRGHWDGREKTKREMEQKYGDDFCRRRRNKPRVSNFDVSGHGARGHGWRSSLAVDAAFRNGRKPRVFVSFG